jgi:hypothetical protein
VRMTHALVQVAAALLDKPDERRWGYDVAKRAGVRSGVLYPMLTRMLNEGWLTDGWEDPRRSLSDGRRGGSSVSRATFLAVASAAAGKRV